MNIYIYHWLFLVPLKGARWHIIPQLAVYTTHILPSGGSYATLPPFRGTRNNHWIYIYIYNIYNCIYISLPYAPIPSASGFGVGLGYLNTF